MSAGEHIYVYCGSYSHHGIDMGDGTVVHFDSTPWQKLTGGVVEAENRATIKRVDYDLFTKGRVVFRREYSWCHSDDLVRQRAQSRLGESGYNLFANNCEHFAVWCKTGWSHSTQVESVIRSARTAVRSVPMALSLLRVARASTGHTRLAMYGAAVSLALGCGLARYVRDRVVDMQRGVS
jgi:hypothetical protein